MQRPLAFCLILTLMMSLVFGLAACGPTPSTTATTAAPNGNNHETRQASASTPKTSTEAADPANDNSSATSQAEIQHEPTPTTAPSSCCQPLDKYQHLKVPESKPLDENKAAQNYAQAAEQFPKLAAVISSENKSFFGPLPKENYVDSPLSAHLALELYRLGLQGEARQEADRLLGLDAKELQPLGLSADQLLPLLSAYLAPTAAQKTAWTTQNLVLREQSGAPFSSAYLKNLEPLFPLVGTGDWRTAGEPFRQEFNSYIAAQTLGLIPEFWREPLDPATTGVLLNILSFKDRWMLEFDKKETKTADFHGLDKTLKVPMMHKETEAQIFNYARDDRGEYLKLPYQSGASMVFILPAQGVSPAAALEHYEQVRGTLAFDNLPGDIAIPRFRVASRLDLSKLLKQNPAWAKLFAGQIPGTDHFFDKAEPFLVDQILQESLLLTDEEGTSAAAVTAITGYGAAPPQPKEPIHLHFDRPFAFSLEQQSVQLFRGLVYEPEQVK